MRPNLVPLGGADRRCSCCCGRSARGASGSRGGRDLRRVRRVPGCLAVALDPADVLRIAAQLRIRLARRAVRASTTSRRTPRATVRGCRRRTRRRGCWRVAAPFLLPGALTRAARRRCSWSTSRCYLPYIVFDDWSYLRFLLPTIPLLLILVVASVDAMCADGGVRLPRHAARSAASAIAAP